MQQAVLKTQSWRRGKERWQEQFLIANRTNLREWDLIKKMLCQ